MFGQHTGHAFTRVMHGRCDQVRRPFLGKLNDVLTQIGLGHLDALFFQGLHQRGLGEVTFLVFACSYALAALCWLAVDVTKPLAPLTPDP